MILSPTSRAPAQPDPAAVISFLRRCLAGVLAPSAMTWVDDEIDHQTGAVDERRLSRVLGLTARKVGRADLLLSAADAMAARAMRIGWQPGLWGTDEAARIAILLATYHGDDQLFARRLNRYCTVAEITEHVAYLKGFAVFPGPNELLDRAREGVRSSAGAVFQAIASHNPYPTDYFDEAAWNQMVVKCVFVGAPMESIFGLRDRRNADLIQMLRDFVAEREVAGRPLPDAVHAYIECE